MDVEFQEKGKWHFSLSTRSWGVEILRATDLVILTVRPETLLKSLRSWTTLGVEIRGDVMRRRMSSANKAHLCVD